ncbi:dihydrolipoyllysine-residue acetyltransferase component 2 of pyruvate dehydrogenase complex, mitochondrial isoform X1 [Populus trichocarpa]|uniref:dihydrolipoyllysine-residue acetyltransferase component 2 of pyruvate dehydrogenase complex, mitochondrial isoform X1 n=1 Tax=Populus trichocarpa TaxID=3694 RepID=UPI000D18B023|nr:dihydrolipoyllysine-residue acetyltransferase component 2 of pyruvate dehydrogenase complex, mitochondrial isoform X1 [Populus trichocarpa]|eukprot:XP_024453708.1 dihydrolipoyllysine-residue acetyltransferase component 2 of pyruvate dehydrogenase complex, mitochondrial isoform X1 [Populus trichocarpa]
MAYASHLFKHSKKLRNHQHADLVRWLSNDSHLSGGKRNDAWAVMEKRRYSSAAANSTLLFFVDMKAMSFGASKKDVSRTFMKVGSPIAGPLFMKDFAWYALLSSQVHWKRGFSSDSGLPPHQEIGMPSLSPTMTEGNIARWLKKEGDKISTGEVLCEVETDKATVEMECMEEGYLAKILKGDGAKEIKLGEVIAITVEDEEDIAKFKDYNPSASGSGATSANEASAPTPPASHKEEVEKPASLPEPKISKPSAAPDGDRTFASPLARKLAEDHNVPLSSIKGTGPDGNIVKADIEDYLASRGKEAPATKPVAKDTSAPALDYVDIPHSQIRKVTASRLLLSKQTIPHYYLTVDTCVDKLMGLRSQLNLIQETSGGKRISVNDLVIKAAALALRKVPQCNSSWTDSYIRQYNNVNINVAVQTDNGLYVPVIRDADKKGLSKIADEVKNLAQKAKENSLKPEDYEGGTFTVSNLGGPFGIKQFCAIINPPQSGILAIGSAEKRVIPGSGPDDFKFASFMSVTLSCDHRVIDGAIGAEWLKAFKGYIENPESMLL